MAINVGDVRKLTLNITVAGAEVDPATVKLHVRKPGDSSVITSIYNQSGQTYPIQKASVGNYFAEVPLDTAGNWLYEWETTGTGAGVEEGEIVVESRRTRG